MSDKSLEDEVVNAVRSGLAKAIHDKLSGYNSPLEKMVGAVVEARSAQFRTLMTEAVDAAIQDNEFRSQVETAIRKRLADLLVQRFGGELEKQVNALKSDPSTRARITIAIDEAVRSLTPPAC